MMALSLSLVPSSVLVLSRQLTRRTDNKNFSRETLVFSDEFFGGIPVGYRPGSATIEERKV